MGIQTFRSINSGKPFRNTANEYLEKGWQPIPLPPKEKFPPPTGFTGRNAEAVTAQRITDWVADPNFPQDSNIGIHLDSVTILDDQSGEDIEYDVIGIDVDITDDKYDKKGNLLKHGKSGGDTIAKMEQDLGKLPETFMSTAHGPGARAGIRFYLVPTGLKWPGKIGDSVDCIQKAHRYAVVSPSWHPTAGQYSWYGTADNATLAGEPCDIPDVAALPMLPAEWVDHLTSGIKDTAGPADVDSTVDEILKWFKRTTAKGDMCRYMDKQVGKAKDAFHHDIHSALRDMQRAIVAGGIEGHPGATKALNRLKKSARRANRERVSTNAEGGLDDGQGGKMHLTVRSDDEFEREWKRSLWGAIRLVKGEVDEGVKVPQPQCACITADMNEVFAKYNIDEKQKDLDVEKFAKTDDGNAEMYMHLYDGNVRYLIERDQWYYLDDERWVPDTTNRVHTMFHAVRDAWVGQADAYLKALGKMASDDPGYKPLLAKFKAADQHAKACGRHNASTHCLESLSHLEDVVVTLDKADADPHLLGCVNGVIELKDDGYTVFRPYDRQEFITKCTAVPYVPWETIMEQWEDGEGEYVRGVELLQDYFDKFIPGQEMRDFVQKIFGSALYGRNPSKVAFFFNGRGNTGKSTLVNLLQQAMGTYGSPGQHDVLNPPSGDRNPSLLAILGRRVINMTEMGSSTEIKSDQLKGLASQDPQSVRDNYSNSKSLVEFIPSFTFICPANAVPYVENPDDETGKRVCCVPFEQQIAEAHKVEGRAAEMDAMCREVLLSWAVEGWRSYIEEGFQKEPDTENGQHYGDGRVYWPEEVVEATRQFILKMSPTGEFSEDIIEFTGDDKDIIQVPRLFSVYRQWKRDMGKPVDMTQKKFTEYIRKYAPVKKVYIEKYNGQSIKISGHAGIRFRDQMLAEDNQKAIDTSIQQAKDSIDGKNVRTANFRTKSAPK